MSNFSLSERGLLLDVGERRAEPEEDLERRTVELPVPGEGLFRRAKGGGRSCCCCCCCCWDLDLWDVRPVRDVEVVVVVGVR